MSPGLLQTCKIFPENYRWLLPLTTKSITNAYEVVSVLKLSECIFPVLLYLYLVLVLSCVINTSNKILIGSDLIKVTA